MFWQRTQTIGRSSEIGSRFGDSRRSVVIALTLTSSLTLIAGTGCKRDPNVQKQKYLESGKRYEKDGKLKEAAIQFSNALKVDRNFGDAHYELGKTYIKMGTMMAGYSELLRTVDLNPSNLPARIDLGNMLLMGGVPNRAQDQAKAVLAVDPNDADAFALLASIAAKKGDSAEALAQIQHALAIDPNRGSFHMALGLIQGSTPQGAPAAEQELQKAVTLDPKNVTARLVLASMLEKKGDIAGAAQQDIETIRDAPKNLQARASLAGLYLRSGDKAKAEATLRQATEDLSDSEEGAELLKDYYVQTGQMQQAETVYGELAEKHPKSFPIKLAYARILAANKNYAKASAVAKDLSKTNGNNPQVELLNGALLMTEGKTNEAFDLLQKATKNAPESVPLHLLLARVAAIKGDVSVSEASFHEAARLDPANLDAQRGLAEIANRRGDSSLLVQVADNTIALHPDFFEAYLWKGTAEANQKQYERAEGDFQTALKKNPQSSVAYLELGQLRLSQQHVPEARAMLEKALERDPNSSRALSLLVALDLNAGQAAKGLARIQEQIAKAPQNANLYSQLAAFQMSTRDFPGALESSKKAMELEPGSVDAVQLNGRAEVALGNTDQAINVWEQWLRTHPNDTRATTILGTLEETKGDATKAMEYYKKTLQLDPNQAMASNNLAYLMVENGQNVDAALSLAQSARRGLPNSPSTADTLAWVFYHKGTYSTARDLLEDALKADPNNASIHYHLGMTYSKLNEKADAELHLKKAVALAPDTQTGKDASAALTSLL